jgi:putative hydrolase of the HAD superfamily
MAALGLRLSFFPVAVVPWAVSDAGPSMKAVLFDLDRTLLDRDAAAVEHARWIWSNSSARADATKDFFVARFVQLDARGRGDKRAWFQTLVSEFALSGTAAAMLDEFEREFPAAIAPFGDAIPLLRALRREGVLTGVVSNGRGPFQRAKLAGSGLLPWLDVTVISEEAGFKKPDPRIFRVALEALRCRAKEAMFVGDSEETDVRGARQVGMFAVLRRYPGENFATEANREISSLGEILSLVRSTKEGRSDSTT